MPRVSKGAARAQARKRILREARGYYGARSKHKWKARLAIRRAGVYAYRDRRRVKREYRSLWIIRLTAACRMRGLRYSQFIFGLKGAGIVLNRKMLAEIAIHDPVTFDAIVAKVKQSLPAVGGAAMAKK